LTPDEWDRIVKGYFSRIKLVGQYLGPYPDSETQARHPSGFEFEFNGLPSFPVQGVRIEFANQDGTTRTAAWTYQANSSLKQAKDYDFRTELLDGETPAHIDLTFTLDGTGYKPHFHIY